MPSLPKPFCIRNQRGTLHIQIDVVGWAVQLKPNNESETKLTFVFTDDREKKKGKQNKIKQPKSKWNGWELPKKQPKSTASTAMAWKELKRSRRRKNEVKYMRCCLIEFYGNDDAFFKSIIYSLWIISFVFVVFLSSLLRFQKSFNFCNFNILFYCSISTVTSISKTISFLHWKKIYVFYFSNEN